ELEQHNLRLALLMSMTEGSAHLKPKGSSHKERLSQKKAGRRGEERGAKSAPSRSDPDKMS
ncbi:MAG: hypothetical protein SGPRY_012374, partial [Prymnesium sp.]